MSNSIRKIENRIKSFHGARLINPQMHWKILLKIFLSLAILAVIFSLYFQYEISTQKISVTPTDKNTSVVVDEVKLKKVNDYFNTKKSQATKIKNGSVKFKDPS